jgi:hypothetical protein
MTAAMFRAAFEEGVGEGRQELYHREFIREVFKHKNLHPVF